jgi:hypothetical protein
MSEEQISAEILARRFAVPVFAVWLLHAGVWIAIIAASQPILSGLLRISNWYVQHFLPTSNLIEEISWSMYFTFGEIAEGIIPIVLGLLLGFWVLRRKTAKSRMPNA